MSKKLILGLALSLVLVSGAFFGAQADCGCCLPHISIPSPCSWFTCNTCNRDKDLGIYNPFPGSVHSVGVAGCCGSVNANMDVNPNVNIDINP